MKKKIVNFIKKKINKNNIITNINKDYTINQKKVAIVYVHENFIKTKNRIFHTQVYESVQIVKYFIDMNYDIDVINCHEENAINLLSDVRYDVIFGLGDIFYNLCLNNMSAYKIIYLTENEPDFSYNKENERVKYYIKRKNIKTKYENKYIERSNLYFKAEHFKKIDSIITMGNGVGLEKYNKPVYTINPTGLINDNYKFISKNIEKAKFSFLWFGSSGVIHKGLDIIYDIFKKRKDLELIICGLNKREQKKFSLKEQNNIKILGKIDVQSNEFLEICNKTCWLIYPSCSEAMSTSVLTCMLHGIIPIVIKENGFDRLEDNAYFLEDYSTSYINNFITDLTLFDNSIIEEKRKKVYEFSRKNFNLSRYNQDITKILKGNKV